MYLDKLKVIYLHPPKTGGTFIENNLINYSNEKKTFKAGFSDNQNMFGLEGVYTKNKHQYLNDYKKLIPDKVFIDLKVLISIREPLDRIISYYFGAADKRNQKIFSLFKNINNFSQKKFNKNIFGKFFYRYKQPKYTEKDFINFINIVSNQSDFLKIDGKIHKPDYLINFSKIDKDLETFLRQYNIQLTEIPKNKYNVHQHQFDISQIKNNKNILEAIRNSHHYVDYKTFNFENI